MTDGEARAIIADQLRGQLLTGHSYPTALPEALARWYCYTRDGGHSLVVALEGSLEGAVPSADQLVPAPVRAVLRTGWREEAGFIVCPLAYSSELGLLTDADDDEF